MKDWHSEPPPFGTNIKRGSGCLPNPLRRSQLLV